MDEPKALSVAFSPLVIVHKRPGKIRVKWHAGINSFGELLEVSEKIFNSKMIVTGDITQIDLPAGTSGLRTAVQVLSKVEDMHFATLTADDVVRHSLVAKIVDAYSRYEEKLTARKSGK